MYHKIQLTMKKALRIALFFLLIFAASCSSDNPDEYKVTVEVSVSTDDDVWIEGIGESHGIYFQNYLKHTFHVQYRNHTIRLSCKNPNALMNLRVWVNGRLEKEKIGNSLIICNYLPLQY